MSATDRRDDAPLHCAHYGRCGGCDALHLPIEAQLAAKRMRAATLLQPFLDGVEVVTELPPRTPRHDRSTLLYPAQLQQRKLQLGIYRRGSHDIEPIHDCRIQRKPLTVLGVRAAELLRELRLPVYDEHSHRGLVRALRARIMPATEELLVGLVVTRVDFSERDALTTGLQRIAGNLRSESGHPIRLVGTVLNHNPERGNALLGPTTIALRGDTFQHDAVGDLRLRVSFQSFYQHHRHADAVLFRPALALLGDVSGLRIVDGYGGIGAFGLRLLRAGAASVTIVESSPSSCADAQVNLQQNQLSGGEVRQQRFGSAPLPPADLMLLDPPRAGLQAEGAAAVLAAQPERVLLVACSLPAAARDLALLQQVYRVQSVRLCDLFPHTEHVETLVLLRRR